MPPPLPRGVLVHGGGAGERGGHLAMSRLQEGTPHPGGVLHTSLVEIAAIPMLHTYIK